MQVPFQNQLEGMAGKYGLDKLGLGSSPYASLLGPLMTGLHGGNLGSIAESVIGALVPGSSFIMPAINSLLNWGKHDTDWTAPPAYNPHNPGGFGVPRASNTFGKGGSQAATVSDIWNPLYGKTYGQMGWSAPASAPNKPADWGGFGAPIVQSAPTGGGQGATSPAAPAAPSNTNSPLPPLYFNL